MLGIVFTEFSEMVETVFSADMLDDIFDDCSDFESGGSYTSVGTYDHREILALVEALSKRTDILVPDLVFSFGEHLLGRFYALYPAFFEDIDGTFEMLSTIENHIHVEVKKLYPDAELPQFDFSQNDPDRMRLVYRSNRPFGDLAAGLIGGCIKHFGESITVLRKDNPDASPPETEFLLTRN